MAGTIIVGVDGSGTARKAAEVARDLAAALVAAHNPDVGTPMGELMARRQQTLVN